MGNRLHMVRALGCAGALGGALATAGCGSNETTGCVDCGPEPPSCGDSWTRDGDDCVPILPEAPCPPGQMALPGESECRPVVACGEGTWGDRVTDETTVFVDQGFGPGGDGTESAPFDTIGGAIAAAAPGAQVAVAEGTYAEAITIGGKAVRLEGVCPQKVVLTSPEASPPCPLAGLCIVNGADGTTIQGVTLTGSGFGVLLSGAADVTFRQVHVRDNPEGGIDADSSLGDTSTTVAESLVERNGKQGVRAGSASLVLESSVVRETLPDAGSQLFGHGLILSSCAPVTGSTGCVPRPRRPAHVRRSVIEGNRVAGVQSVDTEVTIEDTVIRNTLPEEASGAFGYGFSSYMYCPPEGCTADLVEDLTLRHVFIDSSTAMGIVATGHRLDIADTVVRDTTSAPGDGLFGDGIGLLSPFSGTPSAIVGTHIIRSARAGLSIFGSHASVRDVRITCAPIEIALDPNQGVDPVLEDGGNNLCGCPVADGPCKAASAGLEPPTPLE